MDDEKLHFSYFLLSFCYSIFHILVEDIHNFLFICNIFIIYFDVCDIILVFCLCSTPLKALVNIVVDI